MEQTRDLIRYLNKPEYWWQPWAVLRRLTRSPPSPGKPTIVTTPWGLSIEVDPGEAIGRAISHHGIFDISAVEAIFRLVGPHETVVDVGANIGYMTLAALSAEATVNVVAFEPHPTLFTRLSRNRALWIHDRPDIAPRLKIEELALSDASCVKSLYASKDFALNQGIASLEIAEASAVAIPVRATTLDERFAQQDKIGLLKIDVEGHELVVFKGGAKKLANGTIRDILYEDHIGIESDVSRLLSQLGYTIFGVSKLPWGPWLCESRPAMRRAKSASFDSPNFLATLDPDRARRLFSELGFRCMRRQRFGPPRAPESPSTRRPPT